MAAFRYGDGLLVFAENRLVAAVGVEVEVIDGVFLALGPEALPRHVAANGGQHVKADAAKQCLKEHDGDKGPDDAQQPWCCESLLLLHEVPCTGIAGRTPARIPLLTQ
ncbi:hypothetical protein D3C78_1628650 [compost metagenome]